MSIRYSLTPPDEIPSIWAWSDEQFLARAIPVYLKRDPDLVLDLTLGRGEWWANSRYPVVGLDIDPFKKPDVLGNYLQIPIADQVVDVLVWDPPHISTGDRVHMYKRKRSRGYDYGQARRGELRSQFPKFFPEALRVLKPNGILLAKIADEVNDRLNFLNHYFAIDWGEASGLTACDLVIKIRQATPRLPSWRNQHHARKLHSFWIVFRRGRCDYHLNEWRD